MRDETMPSGEWQFNEEVAQVLTHVRQQWGNHAPEVTPAQVDRVRAAQY